MSLFGALTSGVTGLFAQSQTLGIVADNISNINTVGYKSTSSRFSTLVTVQGSTTKYAPGGVQSIPLREYDVQGLLEGSTSPTDIAVSGAGFFVVNDAADGTGDILFTRAGSFRTDKDGNLVNTGGFYLTGFPFVNDVAQQTNVLSEFEIINVANLTSSPQETTTIDIGANVPASAATGDNFDLGIQVFDKQGGPHALTLTFTKLATANTWDVDASFDKGAFLDTSTDGGSIEFTSGQPALNDTITINNRTFTFTTGNEIQIAASLTLTINNIVTKLGGSTDQTLANVAFANSGGTFLTVDDLIGGSNGTGTGGISAVIAGGATVTQPTGTSDLSDATTAAQTIGIDLATITFSSLGTLASIIPASGVGTLNTDNELVFTADYDVDATTTADQVSISLDLGTLGAADGLTQFEGVFTPNFIEQNGKQFGSLTSVVIAEDGTVTALFDNGDTRKTFQVPLVTFNNPNGLSTVSGNAFLSTDNSGPPVAHVANTGGAGTIAPSSLEGSVVDLAEQFTIMIVTQRAFSASARIISTADEMLEELIRIKR